MSNEYKKEKYNEPLQDDVEFRKFQRNGGTCNIPLTKKERALDSKMRLKDVSEVEEYSS